jgi:hypothetical protein
MIAIKKAKETDFTEYYKIWLQMEKQHQYEFWTPLRRKIYGRKFDNA